MPRRRYDGQLDVEAMARRGVTGLSWRTRSLDRRRELAEAELHKNMT